MVNRILVCFSHGRLFHPSDHAWIKLPDCLHDWTEEQMKGHCILIATLCDQCTETPCLEYAKNFDLKRAHAVSNPQLSPHLEFVDTGGHGYATVRLTGDEMRTEFVCIPRPITRSDRPDGGPLRYRVVHTASLWKPGERPLLRQQVIEGDPGLSI